MSLSTEEYQAVLRLDLASFIERSFYEVNANTRLLMAPYIELIAAKLDAVRQGRIKRLIICLPPRSLKSHCASVAFPAFCLGHDPSLKMVCASYGQDLADKLARDCRNLMSSAFYKSHFRTRLMDRKIYDLTTTMGGSRMATSVGGVFTGRGADFIIIDDPLKPEEALSETARKSANQWVGHTLFTRLNDKTNGRIVVLMQRLHQDDLVGHLMELGDFEVLSLPAIAIEDERHVIESPLGTRIWTRRQGQALHPERESLTTLENIRKNIGSYNFASQYQQTPVPLEGNLVKADWLRFYESSERPERFAVTVQSWDTANKATELNDFSVCTTWGVIDRHFYLIDVLRKRLTYPDLRRAAVDHAKRFRANVILIEDKASGIQLIQDLRHDRVFGVKAYQAPSGADKIMRLHAQTAKFEGGQVLLPREAPWLFDYVSELIGFPGTKYDDQVDSTTQALDFLNERHSLEIWAKLGAQYRREHGLP